MTPGIQPRMDRQMLIRKSAPQPRLKKTARGGRKIAMMYRKTSDWEILACLGAQRGVAEEIYCRGSCHGCFVSGVDLW